MVGKIKRLIKNVLSRVIMTIHTNKPQETSDLWWEQSELFYHPDSQRICYL